MRSGILVIGAGQAAVQFATSLRDGGYPAPITIIGEEPHLPYQRPPLSKGYLKGHITAESLRYRAPEFFAERSIAVILGDPIRTLTRELGGVKATSESGRIFTAERVVLAVGATPRELPIPGANADGVMMLRDLSHADLLATRLRIAAQVVVIGGGFIGLELAATARALGASVKVLEGAPRLMGRAVGSPTSEYYLAAARSRGIEVVLDTKIEAIEENGSVTGVRLSDGLVTPASLVIVGVGVVPRTELAEQLGLEVSNGIVVDDFSVASDGQTIALGDCANLPNPYPIDPSLPRVRLESVNNAIEQAMYAAATLLGQATPYRSVPWFWSDQGDLKLQIAGLSSGYDEVVTRGDPTSNRVSFLYRREGRLIAADCVNSPADFAAVRKALKGNIRLDAEVLEDTSQKLSEVLSRA